MRPSRGADPLTPTAIADWEASRYSALRRQRAQAAASPIDDAFPDDPQNDPVAARSALNALPSA